MLLARSQGETCEAELVIADGPTRKSEHHNLTGTRLTIGRETENDLVLSDASVSRFHAEILRDRAGFWIEDKGSADGTKRNGLPVKGQEALVGGDQINIGKYSIRFDLRDENSTAPTQTKMVRPAVTAAASATGDFDLRTDLGSKRGNT